MKMGKTILEIKIGDIAQLSKAFTQHDLNHFAELSGDFNPYHVDPSFMQTTKFGKTLVHGALTTSLWSALFGMNLPGPGCLYMTQSSTFRRPVLVGDTVRAEVEVVTIDLEKNRVTFATRAFNQNEELVAEGQAVLMPRR